MFAAFVLVTLVEWSIGYTGWHAHIIIIATQSRQESITLKQRSVQLHTCARISK